MVFIKLSQRAVGTQPHMRHVLPVPNGRKQWLISSLYCANVHLKCPFGNVVDTYEELEWNKKLQVLLLSACD
jgi:hypothetical protein